MLDSSIVLSFLKADAKKKHYNFFSPHSNPLYGSILIFICSSVRGGGNGIRSQSHAVFTPSAKLIKHKLTPQSPQRKIFTFIFRGCMYNILYSFGRNPVGDINISLYARLISISICSQRAHIPQRTPLTHLNSRAFDSEA